MLCYPSVLEVVEHHEGVDLVVVQEAPQVVCCVLLRPLSSQECVFLVETLKNVVQLQYTSIYIVNG